MAKNLLRLTYIKVFKFFENSRAKPSPESQITECWDDRVYRGINLA